MRSSEGCLATETAQCQWLLERSTAFQPIMFQHSCSCQSPLASMLPMAALNHSSTACRFTWMNTLTHDRASPTPSPSPPPPHTHVEHKHKHTHCCWTEGLHDGWSTQPSCCLCHPGRKPASGCGRSPGSGCGAEPRRGRPPRGPVAPPAGTDAWGRTGRRERTAPGPALSTPPSLIACSSLWMGCGTLSAGPPRCWAVEKRPGGHMLFILGVRWLSG